MNFWLGASSNLLLGSDMKNIDDLSRQLITSQAGIIAAKFCNGYPLQPRNPGTGSNQAMQLQAWLSGPSGSGEAYVLLTNLGENLGHGGYTTVATGSANVSVTLADLGLTHSQYTVEDVWFGYKSTPCSDWR
jgi:alpha-galactosidase